MKIEIHENITAYDILHQVQGLIAYQSGLLAEIVGGTNMAMEPDEILGLITLLDLEKAMIVAALERLEQIRTKPKVANAQKLPTYNRGHCLQPAPFLSRVLGLSGVDSSLPSLQKVRRKSILVCAGTLIRFGSTEKS